MSEPKAQLVDPQGNMNLPGMNATGVITATSFDGAGGVVTGLTGSPNLNVGVVTATSFVGDGTGHAAGLTGTPNLNLGVTTSTGFIGDAVGKAAGLTGTPNLNVGLVTATSFVGDVTGDITGNITGNVTGNITGNVTGNITGIAGTVLQGSNIHVGVVTATSLYGDGSNLTGIAATNFNTQSPAVPDTSTFSINVTSPAGGNYTLSGTDRNGSVSGSDPTVTVEVGDTLSFVVDASGHPFYIRVSDGGANVSTPVATNQGATDGTVTWTPNTAGTYYYQCGNHAGMLGIITVTGTVVDLSAGNCITLSQNDSATVAFANTSTAMDVTMIRTVATDKSTGAVTFDGDDSLLSIAVSDTSLNFVAGGSITFEAFIKLTNVDKNGAAGYQSIITRWQGSNYCFGLDVRGDGALFLYHGNGNNTITTQASNTGVIEDATLYHIAVVKDGTTGRFFVNGSAEGTFTWNEENTNSSQAVLIGSLTSAGSAVPDGIISNVRITNGQALYTSAFTRPNVSLTTTSQGATGTNVKILCCKSSSSTTASDVTTGTITATNSPVAGSLSVPVVGDTTFSLSWPDSVKWNGGSAPTLIGGDIKSGQQFEFLTRDSGLTWYAWEPFKNDVKNYQLWTWGTNSESGAGALGQNATTNLSSPTQVGTQATWRSLAKNGIGGEGSYMGSGIKGDSTLWIWGDNEYGSLGQNNRTDQSSPVQIPGTTWDMHSLARQASHAIKTDGTLWTWGYNYSGQLGKNQTATNWSSPTQVGTDTTWSAVGAGEFRSLAIKTDGTLWSWGRNNNGQLGLNDRTERSSPTQIGTNTTWSKFSAGGFGNFGIKTDGTLWGWGNNSNGYLAQNHTIYRSSPVRIGTGTDWDSISAENRIVMAVKTDGTMWAWGNNTAGALGQNQSPDNINTVSSPMQIPGTTWSIAAAAENGSMKAIKTDGTLWAWGRNYRGVLGLNQQGAPPNDVPAVYSSPVQVPGTNWVDVVGGKGRAATLRS